MCNALASFEVLSATIAAAFVGVVAATGIAVFVVSTGLVSCVRVCVCVCVCVCVMFGNVADLIGLVKTKYVMRNGLLSLTYYS